MVSLKVSRFLDFSFNAFDFVSLASGEVSRDFADL